MYQDRASGFSEMLPYVLLRSHVARNSCLKTHGVSPLQRYLCNVSSNSGGYPHVAIIGSGPSGFYTAKYLLEKHPTLRIDMIEKLPVPFGLVRYGVAPDHAEVKNVTSTFKDVALNNRFRFFGNIEILKEHDERNVRMRGAPDATLLDVKMLQNHYSAVVLAYGAEEDRSINIPNENSSGVLSARSFVNWYNGHPDFTYIGESIDLSKVHEVVIIGNGNVAIDCARILTKDVHELEKTDISTIALEKLKKSSVKRVTIVGRRGAAQSSFTIKELRELTRLPNVSVSISEEDMSKSMTDSSKLEAEESRPISRILELMRSIVKQSTAVDSNAKSSHANKAIDIRFLLRPIDIKVDLAQLPELPLQARAADKDLEILPIASSTVGARLYSLHRPKTIKSIILKKTELIGKPFEQQARDIHEKGKDDSMELVSISCQLLLKSVGYRSIRLRGVPFDASRSVVPHVHGRVVDSATQSEFSKTTATTETLVSSDRSTDGGIREMTDLLSKMLSSSDMDQGVNSGSKPLVAANDENKQSTSMLSPLYVVGWLKNGPTGTVATSVIDAKDTVGSMLADMKAVNTDSASVGEHHIRNVLSDPIEQLTMLKAKTVVSWSEYLNIDETESRTGSIQEPPKPLLKIHSVQDMLQIAKSK